MILPVLSPIVIGKQHPFPHIPNKVLQIGLILKKKEKISFGIIGLPKDVERMIFLSGEGRRYVLLEDIILYFCDELFENYLSRPNVRQPILTQYCDGKQVQCRNRGWMTQWGSKTLGDQGYSAIEILRSFYGNDMYINVAEAVSGIPASWPGYDLTIGVTGEKVQQIQEQLNAIAKAYPAIPSVTVDGIYGPATAASVKKFQNIFRLPASGVVDYPTWYKIQDIYVAVTRIAELQ